MSDTERSHRRFRNILFSPLAARGNAAAFRRVCELAGRDEASVTLVGVIAEPSRLQRLLHGPDHVEQVLTAEHRAMRRRLARCVGREATAGVTSFVEVGNASTSLVTRAIAADHDLLVVTTDEDPDDRATIKRLLRKSPCPVWVIRPTRSSRRQVLAAIDPEPDERELNESILEIAASIRSLHGGELHVVNAWELFGESTMRSSAFLKIDPATLEEQRRMVRDAHETAVADLVTRRLGPDADVIVHVTAGPPTSVIRRVIDRERITVLVMGTAGRTGVAGLVMGNTAEQMIDQLRCSVIAVKPPDEPESVDD
jgi:nucleotide-binding universal stress UspA family protein